MNYRIVQKPVIIRTFQSLNNHIIIEANPLLLEVKNSSEDYFFVQLVRVEPGNELWHAKGSSGLFHRYIRSSEKRRLFIRNTDDCTQL